MPSAATCIDSGSKSNPVSSRADGSLPHAGGGVLGMTLTVRSGSGAPVRSQMICHGTWRSGSLSTIVDSTSGSPCPKFGATW